MLKPGGVLLFDNTLWSKRVTIEADRLTDRDTQNMHAFNQYAKNTPNALVTLLPIRDGITLITKLT
jgi:caffeoyl-CoA O-methyltransferase